MTYYSITTEQLLSLEDNLGHDHFSPIQWEDKWIVSIPDWYGDTPEDFELLNMEEYQKYKEQQ